MNRTFFVVLLVLSFVVGVFAEDEHFAVTPTEKEALLTKAEAALTWFRTMDRNSRNNTPMMEYRKVITPLELMQAATLLKQANQGDVSRMLREMFLYLQPTDEECFNVAERLGDETLDSFKEDREVVQGELSTDSITMIRERAATFFRESLSPHEKMVLYHNPTTPLEMMKAVDALAASGRPGVVRFILRRFLDLEFTPEEAAEIVDHIGAATLMQLSRKAKFAPQGGQVAAKIFAEARKHWRDPDTLREPVDRLGNGEKAEIAETARALWKGGDISIELLLEKLAETDDEKEIAAIQDFLPTLGGGIAEALSETFRSGNATLVSRTAKALDKFLPREQAFLFYSPMFDEELSDELRNEIAKYVEKRQGTKPTAEKAAVVLYLRAKEYFEKDRAVKTDVDGYVRFWNWDAKENKLRHIKMLAPVAYRLFAWRYASLANKVLPDDDGIKRFYLLTLFERTAHVNGLDTPLGDDPTILQTAAGEVATAKLETLLKEAIESEQFAAAQIAATLLGERTADELLYDSPSDKPRILVQAVAAPDRRVRFAALEAVMKLKPERPFSGSSLIVDALMWFAVSEGQRIAVVAHPRQSIASKVGGHFATCGYQVELAATSTAALRIATNSPDVELLVIDLLCTKPAVPNLLQAMRQGNRTYNIPIAVLTDDARILATATDFRSLPFMQKIEKQRGDNPFATSLSAVYPPVSNDLTAKKINLDLFERCGVEPVAALQRLKQARLSLGWLKEIVESPSKIYQLENLDAVVRSAIHSEVKIWQGLELAAVIKSATMQDLIYDIAAQAAYPMTLRQEAADRFKESVDSFGVLLRGKQVQRLYDRYNASELEPKESQELLSGIIDVVEEKTLE